MFSMKFTHFNRTVVFLVLLVATACGGAPATQPATKNFTVGIVNNSPTQSLLLVLQNFKTELTSWAATDGSTITYEDKGLIKDPAEFEAEIKRQVALKVNMIFAVGISSAQIAKRVSEGSNIPVVFAPGGDPVFLGLVKSIQNTEGSVTGVGTGVAYPGRVLDFLSKVAPNAKRIFIVYDPKGTGSSFMPTIKDAAAGLGMELVVRNIASNDEVTAAFADMPSDVDAIFTLPDAFVGGRSKDIIQIALQHKIPMVSVDESVVQGGGLLAYGWDFAAMGKQAATMASRILKGLAPSALPVEFPEYRLSINLQTAQAIGLTVSDDILKQAQTIVR